mgnify:CR=1 FL=1
MQTLPKSTPHYSIHEWSPSNYSHDVDRWPRECVCYQYDERNDTHYSLPYIMDLENIVYESEIGDPQNPYKLLHFKDSQIWAARAFLACSFRAIPKGSQELEDMAFAAFTQRYSIGNRKIGDLIFSHLLKDGHEVGELIDELSGPFPEIHDGDYPHLRKSLLALAKKVSNQL